MPDLRSVMARLVIERKQKNINKHRKYNESSEIRLIYLIYLTNTL